MRTIKLKGPGPRREAIGATWSGTSEPERGGSLSKETDLEKIRRSDQSKLWRAIESVEECCGAGCTTRVEMRARHGTPDRFAVSCFRAVPEFISVGEANAAVARYRYIYEQAPESDSAEPKESERAT